MDSTLKYVYSFFWGAGAEEFQRSLYAAFTRAYFRSGHHEIQNAGRVGTLLYRGRLGTRLHRARCIRIFNLEKGKN